MPSYDNEDIFTSPYSEYLLPESMWRGKPEAISETIGNIPSSAYQLGSDISNIVLHPIQTAKGIGQFGLGLAQLAIPGEQGNEDVARSVGQHFVDRYGSLDAAKQAVTTDPVGVLADVSALLLGGGYLATKAGMKAGQVATKVGLATDPLIATGRGVAGIGKGVTRRDVLKGTGAGIAALAVPMGMMTDVTKVTKAIPPIAKSTGILAGIGKFRGIMDNLSPYLRGSRKREDIITGEVEDWSMATQPNINDLYEAGKFNAVDDVERATGEMFDKLETQIYPDIGFDNAFSQGSRNPKIQSAIDRLHKKHDLVASEFSQINTRLMDDIFNSDLADQRVRTDKKAFESLQEYRKQMGEDFTPTFDVQQSVNEIQVISRQLDNAPDKKIVERKLNDKYGNPVTERTEKVTTGTVEGAPVYKIEIKDTVDGIYLEELYIPNKQGLEKLAKPKSTLDDVDIFAEN